MEEEREPYWMHAVVMFVIGCAMVYACIQSN